MAYFTKDYTAFFKELAANNNRDWFQDNKKRYEESVKKPFQKFIGEAIQEAAKLDPAIKVEVKNTLFRINRDIRFSKNKDPYKLHMSAVISPKGRKDMEYPGFYVQFGADEVWIGGGAYGIGKEKLNDVRYSLIDQPGKLSSILNNKDFKDHYEEIRGEDYKVLPSPFKEAAEKEPLLFKKQLYYMKTLPSSILTKDDLMKTVSEHFKAAHPVNQYLTKAMYH